ncbi:MAG: hypothetical protein H6724_13645 [Sandaracinus sp.]|nr:hypothetical protein [Sandaracinus sp.]MCB9620476.1 hypothetical protein [Sandaracinus sp.]
MAREKRTTRKRITEGERADILGELETLMLRGVTDRHAAAEIAKKYGMTPKTVQTDYCKWVRQAWTAEASGRDREERRTQLRERFDDGFRRAATRKGLRKRRVLLPPDGDKPARVEAVHELVDDPDFGAMARFGKLLIALDGLQSFEVKHEGGTELANALREAWERNARREKGEGVFQGAPPSPKKK